MLRLTLVLFTSIFILQAAHAGPIETKTKEAIELAKTGEGAASLRAMKEATRQLWLTLKFDNRKATLVTQKAVDFGKFTPRESNEYLVGSKVRAYIEPIGFGWNKTEDGKRQININADVGVLNESGKQIFFKKNFGKFVINNKDYAMNLYLNLSLNVSGLVAGKYTIQFIIRDQTRPGRQTIDFPVVLVNPS